MFSTRWHQPALNILQDLLRHSEWIYSSRYGLALFYDSDQSDAVKLGNNVSSRYINDNESVFRFVAVDNMKRSSDSPTSVVLHTSVAFGVDHVEETVDQVRDQLVSEAEKLFPDWPRPDNIKCQKWRYSQVNNDFIFWNLFRPWSEGITI